MVTISRLLLVVAVAVCATGTRAEEAQANAAVEVAADAHADAAVEVAVDAKLAEIVESTCVSPAIVTQYEARIETLELERQQSKKQLASASKAWQSEKAELEGKIAEERVLQMVSAAEMTNVQKEAAAKVGSIERQLEDSRAQHKRALDQLKAQVSALEKTVEDLKSQLNDQGEKLGKRDTEVTEARARLATYSDKVKSLERDVAQSNKKNNALLVELSKAEERLTIAALLSSYYDEGVVLADRAVTALRSQLDAAAGSSSTLRESLEALENYKKSTCQVTEKLYQDHLAATIDPLIAELRRASDPYVKKFQPLAAAELKRAQKSATRAYTEVAKRGRAARADAIALLKANDSVAPYAQQVVDGALVVLLFPFVFVALRIALSLLWLLVRSALCVLTLGFCCGRCARKRSSKLKRKASRKPVTADAPPSATPKKPQPSPPSAARRSGGKKQNK